MKRRTKYGWMELLIGVVLVLLGVFSFSHPESTLTGLVVVYGAVAVVTGIADIIFYVRIDRHIGFGPITSLIMGGISVMTGFNADSELPWDFLGILMIIRPFYSIISAGWIIGFYLILLGINSIVIGASKMGT